MEQTYKIKLLIGLSLISTVVLANTELTHIVNAKKAEAKDNFKVIVTLSGITSSTKDILILVNVKDQTKSKLFNAESSQIKGADKVNYTITFPGSSVDKDDKFTVCFISVNNFRLECDSSINSPLKKPEFVEINLAGDSNKKEKVKGESNT